MSNFYYQLDRESGVFVKKNVDMAICAVKQLHFKVKAALGKQKAIDKKQRRSEL